MAIALNRTKVTSWKGMAVQCQQIQDNNGNAVDTATLVGSGSINAGGSTKTISATQGGGSTFNLDTATGTVITLPKATGTGKTFRFLVTVLATSNSHIVKVTDAVDTMQGTLETLNTSTNAVTGWAAVAGTSDTITLNRTTTGSVTKGEVFEVRDLAATIWTVTGWLTQSGTAATPFSATV